MSTPDAPLCSSWTLWVRTSLPTSNIDAKARYENFLHECATVSSVGAFWQLYCYLLRPSQLPLEQSYGQETQSISLHFFRSGVEPRWEHPSNKNGGKLSLRIRRTLGNKAIGATPEEQHTQLTHEEMEDEAQQAAMALDRTWEDAVLALIGTELDGGQDVCGIILNRKRSEDVLSVWMRTTDDAVIKRVKRAFLRALGMPLHAISHQSIAIDFRSHAVQMNAVSSRYPNSFASQNS